MTITISIMANYHFSQAAADFDANIHGFHIQFLIESLLLTFCSTIDQSTVNVNGSPKLGNSVQKLVLLGIVLLNVQGLICIEFKYFTQLHGMCI